MYDENALKFHDTFKPEPVYISKILELAASDFSGTKQEISKESGIPTGESRGKVGPHIKYAAFMGLISVATVRAVHTLTLTELGNTVYGNDPFLHENLSLWLCHYGLVRKEGGAPQWSFLIHEVHPGVEEQIRQETLFDLATHWCSVPPANMSKSIFSVVKSCYTSDSFSSLSFLDWDNSGIVFHQHSERMDLLFVYAYAIFDSWERLYPNNQEIIESDLKDGIGFNKIFGFTEDESNYVIDSLCDEGLLAVNRQLYPPTIIRTSSSRDVLPLLYSRLM